MSGFKYKDIEGLGLFRDQQISFFIIQALIATVHGFEPDELDKMLPVAKEKLGEMKTEWESHRMDSDFNDLNREQLALIMLYLTNEKILTDKIKQLSTSHPKRVGAQKAA